MNEQDFDINDVDYLNAVITRIKEINQSIQEIDTKIKKVISGEADDWDIKAEIGFRLKSQKEEEKPSNPLQDLFGGQKGQIPPPIMQGGPGQGQAVIIRNDAQAKNFYEVRKEKVVIECMTQVLKALQEERAYLINQLKDIKVESVDKKAKEKIKSVDNIDDIFDQKYNGDDENIPPTLMGQ